MSSQESEWSAAKCRATRLTLAPHAWLIKRDTLPCTPREGDEVKEWMPAHKAREGNLKTAKKIEEMCPLIFG